MQASDLWQELGDGINRRRYGEPFDLNIGAVVGGEGLLVVDSRTNSAEAAALRAELAQLSPLPVGWLFNTHYHWDHTFGNQEFAGVPIIGHIACRTELIENGLEMVSLVLEDLPKSDHHLWEGLVITPPTETFSDSLTLDLGSRTARFAFYGRGHTNSDAALHVDGVTFAGDLIEEGNPPSMGDSFPIDWVDTLGRLAADSQPILVPGHGDTVDVEYLVVARFDMSWLAHRARKGFERAVAVAEIDITGSPYPAEITREALIRAYLNLAAAPSTPGVV